MSTEPGEVREEERTRPTVATPTPLRTAEAPRAAAHVQSHARTVVLEGLHAYYGDTHAVRGVSITFAANEVTAMIGPSGCGKSTVVRCINRMHEEIPGARTEGRILLDDKDIHAKDVDVVSVRRVIGMVFQKPNPFPTMSIYDNVAAGLRLSGQRGNFKERVEQSLVGAGLWEEVKDRLGAPGIGLSGGQQQRLCIARGIAVKPQVILLDEPTSALDPISTAKIEELLHQLKKDFTIVIVTHNMQQAARVSDYTAYMYLGELIEFDVTDTIFIKPRHKQTEDYITGRFG